MEKHLNELEITKKKLDNTVEELRTLNATKDKFFSIIAHDLKNPFNSFLGFSKILHENFDEYDDDQKKTFIALMHSGIMNTYELLEDLLLWAGMQQDRIKFNPKNENLYLLVTKVWDGAKIAAEKKGIDISLNLPDDMVVASDRFIISTVMRNLVSNVLKFTHPGTGKITISANE